MWDYGSERWIPANKIDNPEGLKKLGISNIVVEPGYKTTSQLRTDSGDWNGTAMKLFAFTMAFFMPGIDYSVLGWIEPQKNKQILLGILNHVLV